MGEQRWSDDGWPVDEDGKRTDPIGAYLDTLTPEQRRAWSATCTLDTPRIVRAGDRIRVVYPWEQEQS